MVAEEKKGLMNKRITHLRCACVSATPGSGSLLLYHNKQLSARFSVCVCLCVYAFVCGFLY